MTLLIDKKKKGFCLEYYSANFPFFFKKPLLHTKQSPKHCNILRFTYWPTTTIFPPQFNSTNDVPLFFDCAFFAFNFCEIKKTIFCSLSPLLARAFCRVWDAHCDFFPIFLFPHRTWVIIVVVLVGCWVNELSIEGCLICGKGWNGCGKKGVLVFFKLKGFFKWIFLISHWREGYY